MGDYDLEAAVRKMFEEPDLFIPMMRRRLAEQAHTAPASELLTTAKALWGAEQLSERQLEAEIEQFLGEGEL